MHVNRKYTPLPGKYVARMLAAFLTVVIVFFVVAVPDAHAWWDGGWSFREQILFDASPGGADIKETLSDVPVLVRLHTGNFNFSDAKADGSDLRFVSGDDKVPLKYHIEKFDPGEEIALVWVKVPEISGGANEDYIWLYYGNSSAHDGQDRGGTYDVNQVLVYHLNEQDGLPLDASAYGNNAVYSSARSGLPSVAGNGVKLDGTSGRISLAGSSSLNFYNGFTFSAWVQPDRSSGNARLFSWDDGARSMIIALDDSKVYMSLSTEDGQKFVTPETSALVPFQWSHLAVTVEPGNKITLYVNGVEAVSSDFTGTIPAPSADIVIGASADGGNAFSGDIDELRLSNTARTGAWVAASYQGQGPYGMLTSYMVEESGGSGELPLTLQLLSVIMRTITFDGWVIIGFLFLLGCAAFFVFVQKMLTLRDTKKGNEEFFEAFNGIEHPMELHEKEHDFQGSSLYAAYRTGCEALKAIMNKRGESFDDGNGPSEMSMRNFKASLENKAMYESRRLSTGMIVLNLCVAAGPFLGLLGTVWGVMNTFAGLAESGEANLSAIAPGVAAALATTLAGLLVAIPALFASTYIVGNFKNLNADMNVFLDNFILRLDEGRRDTR